MFIKTFTGPSHIALYFWCLPHSCFVLLYSAVKIIDLRFVLGVNLPCRHFSKCCDFVLLCYSPMFWINYHISRGKWRNIFFPPACNRFLCLNIIWHNLDSIISPRFFWQGGGENYPHPQLIFLWHIWQDLCEEKYP